MEELFCLPGLFFTCPDLLHLFHGLSDLTHKLGFGIGELFGFYVWQPFEHFQ